MEGKNEQTYYLGESAKMSQLREFKGLAKMSQPYELPQRHLNLHLYTQFIVHILSLHQCGMPKINRNSRNEEFSIFRMTHHLLWLMFFFSTHGLNQFSYPILHPPTLVRR